MAGQFGDPCKIYMEYYLHCSPALSAVTDEIGRKPILARSSGKPIKIGDMISANKAALPDQDEIVSSDKLLPRLPDGAGALIQGVNLGQGFWGYGECVFRAMDAAEITQKCKGGAVLIAGDVIQR